jgi:acyl-ACP thioesterase
VTGPHPDAPTDLELTFRVHSYEVDAESRLRPRSLCNYLQEAAGKHARLLGVSMERLFEERKAWVLRRLRLSLEEPVSIDQQLDVHTWPERFGRGPLARRHFVVRRDGAVVARAASEWVVVDLDRRRVTRLPEWMSGIRTADHGDVLAMERAPLPKIDAAAAEGESTWSAKAGAATIDLVGHVTNTQYVDWMLEAVPVEHRRSHSLAEVELQYLRETGYGEAIEARARRQDVAAGLWLHSISGGDAGERVRGRSRWLPRPV